VFHLGSESCSSSHPAAPCLTFIWVDDRNNEFDYIVKILSEKICPVLLETIIQGIFLTIISLGKGSTIFSLIIKSISRVL